MVDVLIFSLLPEKDVDQTQRHLRCTPPYQGHFPLHFGKRHRLKETALEKVVAKNVLW